MAWTKIPKEHHPFFYAAMPQNDRAQTMVMFGGVAGIVGGHMFGGLWGDSVMVRVAAKDFARAVKLGGKPFDPMGRGTPMKDMVLLPAVLLRKTAQLSKWLQLAFDFTSKLPPKKKTAKKKTPSKKKAKKTAKKKTAKKKTAKKKTAKKKTAKKKTAKKKTPSKKTAKKKTAKKNAGRRR